MSPMIVSSEGGETRVQISYEFSRDTINLDVHVPVSNCTLLALQADALEKAVRHLSGLAQSIRLQIDHEPKV